LNFQSKRILKCNDISTIKSFVFINQSKKAKNFVIECHFYQVLGLINMAPRYLFEIICSESLKNGGNYCIIYNTTLYMQINRRFESCCVVNKSTSHDLHSTLSHNIKKLCKILIPSPETNCENHKRCMIYATHITQSPLQKTIYKLTSKDYVMGVAKVMNSGGNR